MEFGTGLDSQFRHEHQKERRNTGQKYETDKYVFFYGKLVDQGADNRFRQHRHEEQARRYIGDGDFRISQLFCVRGTVTQNQHDT